MAIAGDVTLSGDLYGGNFEDWKLRITACLRSRQLLSPAQPDADDFLEIWASGSKEAAEHIRMRVSSEMLRRVKDEDLDDGIKLMRSLTKLARPFRFLDLHAEIRNRVYELLLPQVWWVQDNSCGGEEATAAGEEAWRDDYPPLFHVNSQIRREALSIYYASKEFIIVLPANGNITEFDRETIEKWSGSLVGADSKHLRHVSLVAHYTAVDIKFSKERGLTCTFDRGTMSESSKKMLAEHARSIESTRKALNLSGEAIVLALPSNWNLWKKLGEE